jgi:hypothetical protein
MEEAENKALLAKDVLARNNEFLASKFENGEIRPISTIQDMINLGLAKDDKTLTPEGLRYKGLVDKGFVNRDGSMTTKGEAFTTPLEDITDPSDWLDSGMQDDALDEKKAEMLSIRKANRLDEEPSKPFTETVKELGEGAVGLVKGAYDIAGNLPPIALVESAITGESVGEKITETAEFADKFVEMATIGFSKLARTAGRGGVAISEAVGLMSPEEADKYNKKRDLGLAYVERAQKDLDSVELAELVGVGEEVLNAVNKTREQYIAEYGEKEGQKKFQENLNNVGSVATTIADPVGLAVGAATLGAGRLLQLARTIKISESAKKGIDIINQGKQLTAARSVVLASATKLSDEVSSVSGQLDDAIRIGATNQTTELTRRLNGLTTQLKEAETRLGIIDDGIENISKTANQLEIGLDTARTAGDAIRKVSSGATKGVAVGAEKLGEGVVKLNSLVRKGERLIGFGRMANIVKAATFVTSPVAFSVYAGARIGLAAAPYALRRIANFSKVMSEEMLERTSSTPFFRRVAANESVGGLGRAVASLAEHSTPIAKGVINVSKGVAQAAPATLVYNAINDQGVDEMTLQRAGRDALVFGGLARIVGGRKNMDQVNIDQMFNYRKKLDPDQIAAFDQVKDRDFRYAVSGLDAAYPGMFKWEFTQSGNNFFNPATRRAVINVNDKVGFLKEVATHEAGHMIQHVWQRDDAIVSRMLGDETQSGLVRNADGTLDTEFKAWSDEYNKLREGNGIAPAGLNELAIEYFTDQGVQTLLEDTLRGNLYKAARKTPLRKAVENTFRTLFNATPIVKNLHFKLGGATDAAGRMVMGTGLLADGFREIPEVKAMVRQMYEETAGKPASARPQRIVDVRSDNPNHYQADTAITSINREFVNRGESLPDGVLIPDKNKNGEGVLTGEHLAALEKNGVIDNGDFGKALLIQSMIDSAVKDGMLFINKPIRQGRSEQFAGLAEGYVVPTKWILKKGRLYVEAMDLRQLEKNVDRGVKTEIAKDLSLTRKKIYEDIEKSVEIQNKGQSTDAYYKSVDPKNWEKRKRFINSVLGLQTTRQLGINPMMKQVSPDLVTGIYRTFAFDRLQSAIKTSGDVAIPFGPTSYYSIRDNLMPQSPRFNRNGELIYESQKQKTGGVSTKQGVAPDQQAAVQAQKGAAQRQGQGRERQVRFIPKGKPKATRLASELAKRSKVPLSKIKGSGADGTITPNDIRAYISEQEGKFKPLAFQKEPPMAVDPTISDLVGSEVEFQGRVGTIVDDGGRPVLQDADGVVYELPFGYFTGQSSRQLGVRPTGKRVVDRNNLIKEFEETSRQELREIFGYIDDATDKIVELAELGNSVKRSKGRKSAVVRETPEFQQLARKVTDQQILQAWDRTEKALNRARQSRSINNEDIKAIIDKLEGDIRNIEKLSEAIDIFKQQRVSRPVVGSEATSQVTSVSKADLISQMEIEKRLAEAKNITSGINPPRTVVTKRPQAISRYGKGNQNKDSALARSISFAISGLSQRENKNDEQ